MKHLCPASTVTPVTCPYICSDGNDKVCCENIDACPLFPDSFCQVTMKKALRVNRIASEHPSTANLGKDSISWLPSKRYQKKEG